MLLGGKKGNVSRADRHATQAGAKAEAKLPGSDYKSRRITTGLVGSAFSSRQRLKNLLFDRDSKEGLGLNTSCIKNTVYTCAQFLSHTVTHMHTHTERTCHSVLSVTRKFINVTALCIRQGGKTVLKVQPEREPEILEKSVENKKGHVSK